MRTRQKRVATDTWRSLGCRTTPLEHWSKRKPTVEPQFKSLLNARGSLINNKIQSSKGSDFSESILHTVMILNFRTDKPGQTVQTQIRSSRSSLIRVCTVCHSVCIVWTHYSMVEPHSSNFRVITTNVLGVRIFRKFMVLTLMTNLFMSLKWSSDKLSEPSSMKNRSNGSLQVCAENKMKNKNIYILF